ERGIKGDVFRQIAKPAPCGELARSGVVAQHTHAAGAGLHQTEHQLDQRGLAGAVMADQRHDLARRQHERYIRRGLDAAVTLADATDCNRRLHFASPWIVAGAGGGAMSGLESITPPGSRAGNCDCAQRITWTAGLLTSSLACGAIHSTLS